MEKIWLSDGGGGVDGNRDGGSHCFSTMGLLMDLVGNVQGRERLRRHRLRSEIRNAGAHRVE